MPLRMLTALRVGVNHNDAVTSTNRSSCAVAAEDMLVFWHRIRGLTHLELLEVDFVGAGMPNKKAEVMADILAYMKQLQHLHLRLPIVETPPVLGHGCWRDWMEPSHALGRAAGCCARLTAANR